MKTIATVAVALCVCLLLTGTADAKATKYTLTDPGDPVSIAGSSGFAVVNQNAKGTWHITIQVRDLDANTTYWVYGGGSRGSFTTNAKGHGSWTGSWDFAAPPSNSRIRIRTADATGFNRVLWNGANP